MNRYRDAPVVTTIIVTHKSATVVGDSLTSIRQVVSRSGNMRVVHNESGEDAIKAALATLLANRTWRWKRKGFWASMQSRRVRRHIRMAGTHESRSGAHAIQRSTDRARKFCVSAGLVSSGCGSNQPHSSYNVSRWCRTTSSIRRVCG